MVVLRHAQETPVKLGYSIERTGEFFWKQKLSFAAQNSKD